MKVGDVILNVIWRPSKDNGLQLFDMGIKFNGLTRRIVSTSLKITQQSPCVDVALSPRQAL